MADYWYGLVVGNSRFHWAAFDDQVFLKSWHTPHLLTQQLVELINHWFSHESWQRVDPGLEVAQLASLAHCPPIWVASVVDMQTAFFQGELGAPVYEVDRHQIPLRGLYDTLGLDRILNIWGASLRYSWPIVVVDAGTALAITAGSEGQVLGGAVLPGLALQARMLSEATDALPYVSFHALTAFPPRWAMTTDEAIQSGILYTALAGIESYLKDWRQQHPDSAVVFTGGDGELLYRLSKSRTPVSDTEIRLDPNLMFWGLRAYRRLSQRGDLSVIV
ncbi:MAG: pantothenate kinase [Leptolyngbya sp. SIO4C1]|nr:pantothenate kinase [Leptolyngbya sp. SIO4C1]